MPMTEVYSCTQGQSVDDGAMEIRRDIDTRDQARSDAAEKCELNKKLEKVLYYVMNDEGDRKHLFTYENPYFEKTLDGAPEPGNSGPGDAKKSSAPAAKPAKSGGGSRQGLVKALLDKILYENDPSASKSGEEGSSDNPADPTKKQGFLRKIADAVLYE